MNISVTKWLMIIGGSILLAVGVWFGVQAIPAKDIVLGLFSIAGIVIGVALIAKRSITVSE